MTDPHHPDLKLIVLAGAFGMRNVSPFCLKIELLLASLGLSFELIEESDPRKAPKGKLPYLVADGSKIADSELIVDYIDGVTQGRVYEGLTPDQRARGVALTRLAEDHLYWLMVDARWLDDEWFPNIIDGFFHIAPGIIRPLVANAARRTVRQTLHLHGLGRHSHEEQVAFARQDLQALNDALNENGFLITDHACVYDFAVTGLLSSIYDNEPATWITRVGEEFPALREYATRVQDAVGVYGKA